PVNAAVRRFPDAARRRTGVIDQRVAGNADHSVGSIAFGTDVSVPQTGIHVSRGASPLSLGEKAGAERQRCEPDEELVEHAGTPCGFMSARYATPGGGARQDGPRSFPQRR